MVKNETDRYYEFMCYCVIVVSIAVICRLFVPDEDENKRNENHKFSV